MCSALQETFKRTSHSFSVAHNGAEALELLDKREFDLIISDLRMPKVDGLELLKRARKTTDGLLFIMLTAHGTVDNAVSAMKEGAFDFITKPFSHKTLLASIDRAFSYAATKEPVTCDKTDTGSVKLVGEDQKIKKLLSFAQDIASSKSTVLLTGKSGTGKEVLARFIHENSNRNNKPFVAVNCAALPESLLESELFGHEKGAFTGATYRKTGKFEMANQGTLLLDEIGEMDSSLQAKLLRVIQEQEVDMVGGSAPIPVDIRIIATTNRNLQDEVREGRFREDLYYRLNVIPICLPMLKERSSDIQVLSKHFIEKYNRENAKNIQGLSSEGLKVLHKYDWPGNVRELENIIERAVVLCKEDVLEPSHLFLHGMFGDLANESPKNKSANSFVGKSLPEVEKEVILKTLEKLEGNRTHTAKVLGISIRTLRNKLHEYEALET